MTIPCCIAVDGETCRDHARSSRLEWLETNGSGGFAMGTVPGTSTRRYHGRLVAPLRPRATGETRPRPSSAPGSSLAAEPVRERHVLLARLEEALVQGGEEIALA